MYDGCPPVLDSLSWVHFFLLGIVVAPPPLCPTDVRRMYAGLFPWCRVYFSFWVSWHPPPLCATNGGPGCRLGFLVLDSLSWIPCLGSLVLDSLSWIPGLGFLVLNSLSWIPCLGSLVLDPLSWILATAWQHNSNSMATAWQLHGNCMATEWQLHGNCMANA